MIPVLDLRGGSARAEANESAGHSSDFRSSSLGRWHPDLGVRGFVKGPGQELRLLSTTANLRTKILDFGGFVRRILAGS